MATNRNTPQWSIPLRGNISALVAEVVAATNRPKSAILAEALEIGLNQIRAQADMSKHDQVMAKLEEILREVKK